MGFLWYSLLHVYKVVLTFESVNKNMLMKVYLSSIVHYIKLTKKNYHLLALLQEQEDPENKNKNILKMQFCFVDWSVLNYNDITFYFNLLSMITMMMTMKMMMLMMMLMLMMMMMMMMTMLTVAALKNVTTINDN